MVFSWNQNKKKVAGSDRIRPPVNILKDKVLIYAHGSSWNSSLGSAGISIMVIPEIQVRDHSASGVCGFPR